MRGVAREAAGSLFSAVDSSPRLSTVGGYVYALVGVLVLLAAGWRSGISMLYRPVMDLYGVKSVTQVAAFLTISSGVGVLASSVFGALYDRRGPSAPLVIGALAQLASGALVLLMWGRPWSEAAWYWYAAAVASGLTFPSLAVTVNPTVIRSVPTRPQLALAVTQSGSYLSLVAWSPALAYLIASIGPLRAYAAASLVTSLAALACALAYRGVSPPRREDVVGLDPARWRAYGLTLLPIFLVATSSIALLSFLAPIAAEIYESAGVPREEASAFHVPAVMGAAGLLQTAGGFFWGLLSARLGVFKVAALLYSAMLSSSLAAGAFFRAHPQLASAALLARLFAFGGEPVVHMSMIPAILGGRSVGRAVGRQISVVMVSSIVGPALGGLARDATGTYLTVVVASAAMSAAALASLLAVSQTIPFPERAGHRRGWGLS